MCGWRVCRRFIVAIVRLIARLTRSIWLRSVTEFVKAQRSGKLSDFKRAYLNQWVRKPREGEETALGNWIGCAVEVAALPAPAALGLAVSVDRDFASLGVAGFLASGVPIVAPVENGRRPGVDWAPVEAARISKKYSIPVVIDVGGPAGEDMAAKVEELGGKVLRAKLADYVAACADIYDRTHARTVAHTSDPTLTEAVTGARWRSIGDGRRVFGRKQSESDVSMLEAVTLALWGASQKPTPPPASPQAARTTTSATADLASASF